MINPVAFNDSNRPCRRPRALGWLYPAFSGAALALGTGFSCNLILFGSLAGIIVVEEALARGVKTSFAEFARSGVPVALACIALAVAWLVILR